MRKKETYFIAVLLSTICHLWSFNSFAETNKTINPALKTKVEGWMQNQEVRFLENKGQMVDMEGNPVPFVLFKAEVPGTAIYITEKGITYLFVKPEDREFPSPSGEKEKAMNWERIDMELQGAIIKKENIIKETASITDFNFFLSHYPQGIYGVKEYEKITIKEIYPGIDWILYNSSKKGFKYDFVVHSQADPDNIQLKYISIKPIKTNEDGSIEIETKYGTLKEQNPYSYIKETKKEITSIFQITNQKRIKNKYYQTTVGLKFLNFKLSNFQTLIIDPLVTPILTWGTYYGGNNADGFCDIVTDASGNLFIAGYNNSINFPTQNAGGYFWGTNAGGWDACFLKFSNTGALLWATYYGGTSADIATSVSLDGNGNMYATGVTNSTDFPTQNSGGYFLGANVGGYDTFILKFTNASVRQWATYYGGSGNEWGYSVSTDGTNNVFVTGNTTSSNLPTLAGGGYFQNANAGLTDIFILKFSSATARLWSTYYGGSGDDSGYSIAIDGANNVFVTGVTNSANFPTQNSGGYFLGSNAGITDAFLLKFTNAGVQIWSTYYGGSGDDFGYSIATDGSGNLFLTGVTRSADLPIQNSGGYFQAANAGGTDVFIVKFDNNMARVWSTYYGGSGNEWEFFMYRDKEIIVDASGDVFITGYTKSTDFPTMNSGGYYQSISSGTSGTGDVFILQFSNSGVRKWATYNGTTTDAFGSALAIDPSGCLFAVGEWRGNSSNGLINPGGGTYYNDIWNGSDDSYIMKFCSPLSVLSTTAASTNILCNGQCIGTGIATPSGGTSPYTYSWSTTPIQTIQTATGLCTGTYTVTVIDAANNTATATISITQPPPLTATVTVANSVCGNNNGSASVNAGGGTPGYTYSWNPSGQTSQTATGLAAGNYTATITDANNCTTSQTVTVIPSGSVTATTTNSTICTGQNATLTASGGTNYLWSNGQTTVSITLSPTATTTYSVIVSSGACSDTAFATVTVNSGLIVSAGSNITICTGSSVTLTASGGSSYSWSNGQTISSITISPTTTTTYTVIGTDNGCTGNDSVTVVVTSFILANAGPDGTICAGNNIPLNASGGTGYSWIPSTGLSSSTSSNPTASPTGTTTYTVVVTSGSCVPASDWVTVFVNPNPVAIAWNNVTITQGQTATLTAIGGISYSWSSGANGSAITVIPLVTTVYCVTVTDANNCTDTACVTVTLEPIDCSNAGELYLPNAFSPNNDGENDMLQIYYGNIKCIKTFKFVIYNRWGEKVFETTNATFQWDGASKEKIMNTAVFVYYMKATLISDEEIMRKGNISLIR